MTILAPRLLRTATIALLSNALSPSSAPKSIPSIRGSTPTVSKRCPGKDKADQIAECIGQSEDFGRHTALGLADRLILGPPFAPCPWRWTLTIVEIGR